MGGWCRAGPGAGGKGVTGSREGRVNMLAGILCVLVLGF